MKQTRQPVSATKQSIYLDVYALNSNREAKSASKNLKNVVEDRVRSQI
jgi:hypothetical protein